MKGGARGPFERTTMYELEAYNDDDSTFAMVIDSKKIFVEDTPAYSKIRQVLQRTKTNIYIEVS